jgi:hypothetical protein
MAQPLSRIDAPAALAAVLAPHGLNVIGATPAAAYDAAVPADRALARLVPDARSMVVIGNGGGAFWDAFQADCRAHPGHADVPDPLDAFTRRTVAAAVVAVGLPGPVLYPFDFPATPVSFVHLAECAGLGRRSLLGVLLHPVYGPWLALRAAVAVPFVAAAPRPADGFDPCPTCVERACVAACPADAVTAAGWDVPRCAGHRARPDDPCAARCHARFDCVIGREHRYPAAALAYHQKRARPLLLTAAR